MTFKKTLPPLVLALFMTVMAASVTDAQSLESLNYDIFFGDRQAGFAKSWQDTNGDIHGIFEFNDRGRGPHIEETVRLNSDGLIIYQRVKGHNYYKETVDELFEVKDGNASWKSSIENGSAPFEGSGFYMSVQGNLNSELLIRKLMESDADEPAISLLPEGKAVLSNLTNHRLSNGTELKLATVRGLSFAPQYLWLDKDSRLFASVNSWFAIIQKGHESHIDTLKQLQEQQVENYYLGLANRLIRKPASPIAITNVSVFNSATATVTANRTVLIEDSTIKKVGPAAEVEIPESARRIDGRGKTLLPGLFDMHTHGDKLDGILNLAAGVTSVRDMANSLDLPELQEDFNTNTLIGPRIVTMSGFIDQAGPYAGPTGKIVETLEEGLAAVSFYHERGYEQIKLYSSIDPEWVEPLAEKAHELGMRVSGHIPAYMLAEEAVKDGYDEIQHVNMIALNFMPDTLDTRTPVRFTEVGKRLHALDLQSKAFVDFMKLLKASGTVVDPTVSIFEGMLTVKPGEADPSFDMVLDRLPVQIRRSYYSGGLPVPQGMEQRYKDSYRKMLDIVGKLYEFGITIVPGTDALAGFGLHRELENYVRAGIPAKEVLKIATMTSARVAGVSDRLGSVEEGKLADLILVDGNPALNISDIRKVSLTIKDGNIYRPEELYPAIGVAVSE